MVYLYTYNISIAGIRTAAASRWTVTVFFSFFLDNNRYVHIDSIAYNNPNENKNEEEKFYGRQSTQELNQNTWIITGFVLKVLLGKSWTAYTDVRLNSLQCICICNDVDGLSDFSPTKIFPLIKYK